MADVITRFKLETTQYDSKLRDAAKSLSDYARQATMAGNEFGKFTEKNVEAAKAFGNIATSATNSKDKVKELVSAFNTLAKTYNDLTQEQQQSDFGKAMAGSLNTLKDRITEAKQELYSMGDSGKSTGGIMGVLKDKLTVNIDALKLFNVGLTAAKAALDVAKDAFFASEANVDEWGRTMQSAQGLYEGFLNAINNGDISGYLSRMNDIVIAARAAYDELDKLGTMKTIQGPQFSKQEAENNRFRTMIMTGRWISAGDGRKSPLGLKDGDLLSPDQIKTLERQLQNGMQTIVSLTKNELKQTGVAIDKYYDSLAKQNGMTMDEFRKGTSSWSEFSKRVKGAQDYAQWQYDHSYVDQQSGRLIAPRGGNPHAEYRGWDVFRVDKMGQNSYNELVGLIKQQQSQQSQMYSTIGQAYRTINRAEGITVKGIMGGGGKGGGGRSGGGTNDVFDPTSIAAQETLVQELTKLWRTCGETVRDEYKTRLDEAKAVLQEMQNPTKQLEMAEVADLSGHGPKVNLTQGAEFNPLEKISNIRGMLFEDLNAELERLKDLLSETFDPTEIEAYGKAMEEIVERQKKLKGEEKDKKDTKGKDVYREFNDKAEKLVGGMSSISTGLKGLGVEVPKQVDDLINTLSSVMQIIQGVQAIISIGQIGAISANTAAVTANTYALIAKSFFGFEHGGVVHAANGWAGVVPGSQFSGDNIPIMANAGEVVLTRAMAGNLASQLDGGMNGLQLSATVRAEQIDFVMNNRGRRTGHGEYVQSNKRR